MARLATVALVFCQNCLGGACDARSDCCEPGSMPRCEENTPLHCVNKEWAFCGSLDSWEGSECSPGVQCVEYEGDALCGMVGPDVCPAPADTATGVSFFCKDGVAYGCWPGKPGRARAEWACSPTHGHRCSIDGGGNDAGDHRPRSYCHADTDECDDAAAQARAMVCIGSWRAWCTDIGLGAVFGEVCLRGCEVIDGEARCRGFSDAEDAGRDAADDARIDAAIGTNN